MPTPKPDDIEPDPAVSFDDVVRKLLAAKPAPRKTPEPSPESEHITKPQK